MWSSRASICAFLFLLFFIFWIVFWCGSEGKINEWFTPAGYYVVSWQPPSTLGGWKANQLSYRIYITSAGSCPTSSSQLSSLTPKATIPAGSPLSYQFSDGDFGTDYNITVVAVSPNGIVGMPACKSFTPQTPQAVNVESVVSPTGQPILAGYNVAVQSLALKLSLKGITPSQLPNMVVQNGKGVVQLYLSQLNFDGNTIIPDICDYGAGASPNLQVVTSSLTSSEPLVSFINKSPPCKYPADTKDFIVAGGNSSVSGSLAFTDSDGGNMKTIPFRFPLTDNSQIGSVQSLIISKFVPSSS